MSRTPAAAAPQATAQGAPVPQAQTPKRKHKLSKATREKLSQAAQARWAGTSGGGGTTAAATRQNPIEQLLTGIALWTPQQVTAALRTYRRTVAILEGVEREFQQETQQRTMSAGGGNQG